MNILHLFLSYYGKKILTLQAKVYLLPSYIYN